MAGGKVRLTWAKSPDPNVTGYVVFRSNAPFSTEQEAVRITPSALAASIGIFEDLPPADGLWVYRVAAVNSAGTLSELTNAGQATSDGTAPKAVSISYTTQGKTDPATGRMGQGVVSVVLKTNEALQMTPYLSVVPEGGAPIPVELTRSSDTEYRGTFLISSNTPGAGTSATNLRLLLNPADQPTGQVPQGVSVQLPSPVNIQENQSLNLPVTFSANNDAQPTGKVGNADQLHIMY